MAAAASSNIGVRPRQQQAARQPGKGEQKAEELRPPLAKISLSQHKALLSLCCSVVTLLRRNVASGWNARSRIAAANCCRWPGLRQDVASQRIATPAATAGAVDNRQHKAHAGRLSEAATHTHTIAAAVVSAERQRDARDPCASRRGKKAAQRRRASSSMVPCLLLC